MRELYHRSKRPLRPFIHLLVLLICMGQVCDVLAQPPKKKAGAKRAGVYSDVPYNYNRVGSTHLYARFSDAIDFMGYFEGSYYSSTYADRGYYVALKVDDGSAQWVNCTDGSNVDGVTFQAIVEEQAELARVTYQLTNTNDRDVSISMGTHADVQIGNNDWAPIYRRTDTFGMTYGLTMMDGNGAQLCVLFGSGLAGVTSVDDFWFAYYGTNDSASETVGDYNPYSNWLQEGGGYDSGMGWCWKNRLIPAGATVSFSFLIGVGEVNLEPNSTFAVTPDDPEGWNDLSLPHRLIVEGSYESPAGLDGMIEYAAEDEDTWLPLTDMLSSGEEFTSTLTVMFDANNYDKHKIKFRTRDNVGNTTMLQPIEYIDVRPYSLYGIAESKVYTGDSIFQDNLTCDMEDGQWTAVYHNNVNVGRATVNLEGVFPYTIGRKPYYFNIVPQPLTGSIVIEEDNLIFNREYQYPSWHFTQEALNELEEEKDYTLNWENNFLPGTATLTVNAKGNYEGSLSATFTIKKAPLTDDLYSISYPEPEINYDGEGHGADITIAEYVGTPTITYVSHDGNYNSTEKPSAGGEYDVYLEIAEGEGYLALDRSLLTTFVIYQVDEEVLAALQRINDELGESGTRPWDFSEGMKSVFLQPGIGTSQGRVTSIDLSGKGFSGEVPQELFSLPDLEQLNLSGNGFEGDIANQLTDFAAQGGTLSTTLHVLDISYNQFTGNVGVLAAHFSDLQTLYAHNNCFSAVDPMVSPTVSTLTLHGQQIPNTLTLSLSDLVSPSFLGMIPTIITYTHGAQAYSTAFDLLLTENDPTAWDNGAWTMKVNVVNENVTLEKYGNAPDFTGENPTSLYLTMGTGTSATYMPVSLTFEIGDVNFSGDVNVLDLQAMINYIFQTYGGLFNYTAANIWTDQTINVQDVIGMVSTLMAMDLPTQMANHAARLDTEVAEASVFCDNGTLYLSSLRPVAAFDIFVNGSNSAEISQTLQSMGISCTARQTENGMHLIGYSMSGATLPEGTTAIATLSGGTTMVAHAMLSDLEATEIPVMLNNDITGLELLMTANMDVKANAEGIVLLTKKSIAQAVWSIYHLDGSLIDKGVMRNITTGHYLLQPRTELQGNTWIVKVAALGEKEIIKKINIR